MKWTVRIDALRCLYFYGKPWFLHQISTNSLSLVKTQRIKQSENMLLCFILIWGEKLGLCLCISFNAINHSAATFLTIIFSLITIIISLNRHVYLVHFKYLSWHSFHDVPWGSPISWSALMETLQPAARDGKTTSEPKCVFHLARGNCKHNSRKLHLWGAPLSSVASGPERHSHFPPFSSTLSRLMWASQLASELASGLVSGLPCRGYDSNLPPSWQKTLPRLFYSILVAGNENSPLGRSRARLQLCKGCDGSPKNCPKQGWAFPLASAVSVFVSLRVLHLEVSSVKRCWLVCGLPNLLLSD